MNSNNSYGSSGYSSYPSVTTATSYTSGTAFTSPIYSSGLSGYPYVGGASISTYPMQDIEFLAQQKKNKDGIPSLKNSLEDLLKK